MEINILIRAVIVGIITSLPIGPIGILCIHKTIYDGKKYGYASAFGSVTADVIFATIAAVGISAVSELINGNIVLIKVVAAFFLGIIGIRVYFMNPSKNEKSFYEGKIFTCRYYFAYELVKIEGLAKRLTDNNPVTMEMEARHFND